jgi:hypothetical protein
MSQLVSDEMGTKSTEHREIVGIAGILRVVGVDGQKKGIGAISIG